MGTDTSPSSAFQPRPCSAFPIGPVSSGGLPPTGDWLLPPAAPRPGTGEPGPASQCPLPKSSWKLALGRGQELPQTGRSAGVTLPAGAGKSQPLIASGCQLSRGPPTPTGPSPDAVSAHVVLAGLASSNAGQPGEEAAWLMEKQRFWTWWPCPNPLASLGLHSLGQRAKNEECSRRDQVGRSLETRAPPAVFPQPASGRQGSGADEFVEQTDNSW